jgi:hypothetical protein
MMSAKKNLQSLLLAVSDRVPSTSNTWKTISDEFRGLTMRTIWKLGRIGEGKMGNLWLNILKYGTIFHLATAKSNPPLLSWVVPFSASSWGGHPNRVHS